jgi:small subunit ribosomal protein S6
MSRNYEIMILLDNEVVRAGWKEAKAAATALIEKHGGKVLTARRWEERKLAYVIRQRRRGTYLLVYAELQPGDVAPLRREFDLTEIVLRYLILSAEEIPAEERTLSEAESAVDFVVPAPPVEDMGDFEEEAQQPEEPEDEAVPAGELAEEEV